MTIIESRNNIYIDNSNQHGDIVTYAVRVRHKDGRVSKLSDPFTTRVGITEKPPTPENFRVEPGFRCCMLTWDFPTTDNYMYTEVWASIIKSGEAAFFGNTIIASANASQYELMDTARAKRRIIQCDAESRYCFKIRHVDRHNNYSDFSTVICKTPRKIQAQDIDQNPELDQIVYIKPKDGIPATDIVISIPDGNGQIVNYNFQNWYDDHLQTHIDLNTVDLNTNAKIVENTNKITGLETTQGDQYTNVLDQINLNKAAIESNADEIINNDSAISQEVAARILNDDNMQAILTQLGLEDEDLKTQTQALREYNDDLNDAIDEILQGNESYRLAKNISDQAMLDLPGTKMGVRVAIAETPALKTAVETMMNTDPELSAYLTGQGMNSATTNQKADFLLENMPFKFIPKLSNTATTNDEWKTKLSESVDISADSSLYKKSLKDLYDNSEAFRDELNDNFLADADRTTKINELDLATADNFTKIKALIDSQAETITKLNEVLDAKGLRTEFNNYKAAQKAIDDAQQAAINNHTARLNAVESTQNDQAIKISKAVSAVVVGSSKFTTWGSAAKTNNAEGMQTVTIDVNTDVGGLINTISTVFVIRPGVEIPAVGAWTSTTAEIIW